MSNNTPSLFSQPNNNSLGNSNPNPIGLFPTPNGQSSLFPGLQTGPPSTNQSNSGAPLFGNLNTNNKQNPPTASASGLFGNNSNNASTANNPGTSTVPGGAAVANSLFTKNPGSIPNLNPLSNPQANTNLNNTPNLFNNMKAPSTGSGAEGLKLGTIQNPQSQTPFMQNTQQSGNPLFSQNQQPQPQANANANVNAGPALKIAANLIPQNQQSQPVSNTPQPLAPSIGQNLTNPSFMNSSPLSSTQQAQPLQSQQQIKPIQPTGQSQPQTQNLPQTQSQSQPQIQNPQSTQQPPAQTLLTNQSGQPMKTPQPNLNSQATTQPLQGKPASIQQPAGSNPDTSNQKPQPPSTGQTVPTGSQQPLLPQLGNQVSFMNNMTPSTQTPQGQAQQQASLLQAQAPSIKPLDDKNQANKPTLSTNSPIKLNQAIGIVQGQSQPQPTQTPATMGGGPGPSSLNNNLRRENAGPSIIVNMGSNFDKYLNACLHSYEYIYGLLSGYGNNATVSLEPHEIERILEHKDIEAKLLNGLPSKVMQDKESEFKTKLAQGNIKWNEKPVRPNAQKLIEDISKFLETNLQTANNYLELYASFHDLSEVLLSGSYSESTEEYHQLKKTVLTRYNEDKIYHLQCILILFYYEANNHKSKSFKTICKKFLDSKKHNELWETFKLLGKQRSLEGKYYEEIGENILQILREQLWILKCLYLIYNSLEKIPSSFYNELLNTFVQQGFQGAFLHLKDQIQLKHDSNFAQQRKVATEIRDMCNLFLIGSLRLNEIIIESKKPTNQIFAFKLLESSDSDSIFKNLRNLEVLPPVSAAWSATINCYLEKNQIIDKDKKDRLIKELKSITEHADDEHLYYMLGMMDRDLFISKGETLQHEFRGTVKSWVALLSKTTNNDSTLENLVSLSTKCLKDRSLVDEFWTEDYPENEGVTGLGFLIDKLIKKLPSNRLQLVKLLRKLTRGSQMDDGSNYSFRIVRLLGTIQFNDYYASESDMQDEINIKRYSSSEKVLPRKQSINFWAIFHSDWVQLLNELSEGPLDTAGDVLVELLKLSCDLISNETGVMSELWEFMNNNNTMRSLHEQIESPLIYLLISTYYSMLRLKNPPISLLSKILQVLTILIHTFETRDRTCRLIQLFPHTVTLIESGALHGESYRRGFTVALHPIFEIITLMRKYESTVELSKKRFKLTIQLLKLAEAIFLNIEYPLDSFPNEEYFKHMVQNQVIHYQDYSEIPQKFHSEREKGTLYESLPKLCAIYEEENQLKLFSTFLDNMLSFVFLHSLRIYERTPFLPEHIPYKWKIGYYIFNILDMILQKFIINLDRVPVALSEITENPILKMFINNINASNVDQFIVDTLEVVVGADLIKNKRVRRGDKDMPLGIHNRNYSLYVEKNPGGVSRKNAENFREMLYSCLSVLETIVNLVEIHKENEVAVPDKTKTHQIKVSELNLVKNFDIMLNSREKMHYYSQNFIHDNVHREFKINFILAIAANINFEYVNSLEVLNKSIKKFTFFDESLFSQELIHRQENFLSNSDFNLTKNLNLIPKLKNNLHNNAVSSQSIRVISKIVVLWDSLPTNRKPILFELLSSISLESITGNSLSHFLYYELLRILMNYRTQNKEATAILELFLVSMYSQRSFVDTYLMKESLYTFSRVYYNYAEQFAKLITDIIENGDPTTLDKSFFGKLIVFLYEIFSNGDRRYTYFLGQLRKNSEFMNSLVRKVFQVFPLSKNQELYDSIQREDQYPLKYNLVSVIKSSNFQIGRLNLESDIHYEILGQFINITTLRLLINEIITKGSNVTNSLKDIFEKHFPNWVERFANSGNTLQTSLQSSLQSFFQELYDGRNFQANVSDPRSVPKTLIINELVVSKRLAKNHRHEGNLMVEEQEEDLEKNETIVDRGLYKLLDINLFGYGRNFQFDSQELFHCMKLCSYKPEFVYHSLILIRRLNVYNTIVDMEIKFYESWLRFFLFISSLGPDGYGTSTMISPLCGKMLDQKHLLSLFKDNEISLVYPNCKIDLGLKRSSIFNKDEKLIEFLNQTLRILSRDLVNELDNFEDALFQRILDQKLLLGIYCISSLRHLLDKNPIFKGEKTMPMDLSGQLVSQINMISIKIFEYNKKNQIEFNITRFSIFSFMFFSLFHDINHKLPDDFFTKLPFLNCLIYFLRTNQECYAILLSIFHIILKISPERFLEFIVREGRPLVEHVLEKLKHPETTNQEFLAIIKLLIELFKTKLGAQILMSLMSSYMIVVICSNERLKNIEFVEEYDSGCRNSVHVIWCWVLVLFREFTQNMLSEPGFINSALFFIKNFRGRIINVLKRPHYLKQSSEIGFGMGYTSGVNVPQGQAKFSLAYLEELENTLLLLTVFFSESAQWTQINSDLFESIIFHMTNFTVNLFQSNTSLNDNYVPFTKYEQTLKSLFETTSANRPNAGLYNENTIMVTATPIRFSQNKLSETDYYKTDSKENNKKLAQAYNPSIFNFRIELMYQNILLSLMYCLRKGLVRTKLLSNFQEGSSYKSQSFGDNPLGPSTHLEKYNVKYWETMANSLKDCQIYKRQTANKWISNKLRVENLLLKYKIVMNSIETAANTWFLNGLDEVPEYEDLIKNTEAILTLTFEVSAIHFELFIEFRKSWNISIGNVMHVFRDKTVQNIDECEHLILSQISSSTSKTNSDRLGRISSSTSEREKDKKVTLWAYLKAYINQLKL